MASDRVCVVLWNENRGIRETTYWVTCILRANVSQMTRWMTPEKGDALRLSLSPVPHKVLHLHTQVPTHWNWGHKGASGFCLQDWEAWMKLLGVQVGKAEGGLGITSSLVVNWAQKSLFLSFVPESQGFWAKETLSHFAVVVFFFIWAIVKKTVIEVPPPSCCAGYICFLDIFLDIIWEQIHCQSVRRPKKEEKRCWTQITVTQKHGTQQRQSAVSQAIQCKASACQIALQSSANWRTIVQNRILFFRKCLSLDQAPKETREKTSTPKACLDCVCSGGL